MISGLRRFNQSEVAQERLRIINYYNQYGEQPTKLAFGVDRKLIYVWKKKLAKSDGRLPSLVPKSTTPKTTRVMLTHPKVIGFIKDLREKRNHLGKEKIKPLLDVYCRKNNLPVIATSTIGKIIKRHGIFPEPKGVYHNPNSKRGKNGLKTIKKLRVKHPPKHSDPGHIQADTVKRITQGITDYFYSAIDYRLKFSLTLHYKKQTSKNMADFYQKFKFVYPGNIRDWQSDNGAENMGVFEELLKKDGVPHFFTYPRCPKINGCVERYNRTIQEEFIDQYLDELLNDPAAFERELADYVVFYNTQRVHKSLNLMSPIDYLISTGGMSKKSVASTQP